MPLRDIIIVLVCLVSFTQSVPIDLVIPPAEFAHHPILSNVYHICLDLMDDDWCLPEFRPKKCSKIHWHQVAAQFEGDHCMSLRDKDFQDEKKEEEDEHFIPNLVQYIPHDEGNDDILIYSSDEEVILVEDEGKIR